MRRVSIVLALVMMTMIVTQASALDFQQKSFYAQGLIALPMGNFGDVANVGFGPGVGMLVPHTPELSFRGEISYIFYSTDSVAGVSTSASEIPLVALAQYNLTDSPAYLLGGLGLAFGHASAEYNGFKASSNSTDLDLVLGGGYEVSPQLGIEARLSIISDANQISFHGVYHF